MRTTHDLPEELVESVRKALGFKSKTDTIVVALRELLRRHRVDELKDLLGRLAAMRTKRRDPDPRVDDDHRRGRRRLRAVSTSSSTRVCCR